MKKALSFFILFFTIFYAFSSPYWLKDPDFSDYLNSWIGIYSDELIKAMGPVNSVSTLSDGSKVMKYEKSVLITTEATYKKGVKKTYTKKDDYGRTYTETIDTSEYEPGTTREYSGQILFTVDPKNIIKSYSYDGDSYALKKLVKDTSSPFFDTNSFYLSQYGERANIEWIGKLVDDVKLLYENRSPSKKDILIQENVDDKYAFVNFYCEGRPNSGIKYYYNLITKEITEVTVYGNYNDVDYLFFNYKDIISMKTNSNIHIDESVIFGLSYGSDNTFGITYSAREIVGKKVGCSSGLSFYFDKDFNVIDINWDLFNICYNLISEESFDLYTGAGFDLGWNFGDKNHGFNLGFPIVVGTTIKSLGIEGVFRPGFFTEEKLFWKVQIFYKHNTK